MRRVLLMALLCGVMGAGCARCGQEKGRALPLPAGQPRRPVGLPAVAAPVTRDGVAAYVSAHNLPGNRGPREALRVDGLEILASREVTRRLQGASTGLGDDELVGFATISGGLFFSGPALEGKPVRFEHGYAAFDASSGNLLMVGTLGSRSE